MAAISSASPDPIWPMPGSLRRVSWLWTLRAASGSDESDFAPPQPAPAARATISSVFRAVFTSALSHALDRMSNTTMQLFVIRHAIAEDVGPGIDDTTRELTEAGKTKLRRAVRGLRALDIRFERILTSPWKRAVQTARHLESIAASPP